MCCLLMPFIRFIVLFLVIAVFIPFSNAPLYIFILTAAANGVVIATEKKLPSILVDETSVSLCLIFLLCFNDALSIVALT